MEAEDIQGGDRIKELARELEAGLKVLNYSWQGTGAWQGMKTHLVNLELAPTISRYFSVMSNSLQEIKYFKTSFDFSKYHIV